MFPPRRLVKLSNVIDSFNIRFLESALESALVLLIDFLSREKSRCNISTNFRKVRSWWQHRRRMYHSGRATLARVSEMTSGCIVIDQKNVHRNVIFDIFATFFLHLKNLPLARSQALDLPRSSRCKQMWSKFASGGIKNKDGSNELTDFEKSRKQIPKVMSRSQVFRLQTSSAPHPYYSISFCPRQEKLYESYHFCHFRNTGRRR